jgi:hypothetical protein
MEACRPGTSTQRSQETCKGMFIQEATTVIANNTAYGAGQDVFTYDLDVLQTKQGTGVLQPKAVSGAGQTRGIAAAHRGNSTTPGQRGLLGVTSDAPGRSQGLGVQR